ncbi:hypothetical protein GCM10011320_60320 [Neoroseomonas lacus]|uniref:Autotransporter domain-containing protein n=2 Tax=Neoroseomonas lacus TaxID=287609 RepID=A0A917NZU3_9PROT|nr:hypothetical protein GCM10011320_60320 [Neoroseomonas lacus]
MNRNFPDGLLGGHVNNDSMNSLQSVIGLRVDRRFRIDETMAIQAAGHIGWAYEMLDTSAHVTASFLSLPGSGFTVRSPALDRNSAVIGVRAALETDAPVQVFASYDAALNGSATAQAVTAGFRWTW